MLLGPKPIGWLLPRLNYLPKQFVEDFLLVFFLNLSTEMSHHLSLLVVVGNE